MTLQYKHNIRIVSGNIFVLASKQESKAHQSLAFHHVSKTGTNRFYIYQQRMYKHAYYIYIYTYYITFLSFSGMHAFFGGMKHDYNFVCGLVHL
jgi:hypothetical protein